MSVKSKRRAVRRHHGSGSIPRQRPVGEQPPSCPNCFRNSLAFLTWDEWSDHARRAGEPPSVWVEERPVDLLDTAWPYWWCHTCRAGGPLLAVR